MEKFSIVMPFRDTPRERKFAEKSIPSAIALGPDELIIGVDAPAHESLLSLISDLCSKYGFSKYRALQVPRSKEWRFQLANIIWHCYKESRHDRILAFDVDSVLRPAVMRGLNEVGNNNAAIVSFTKKNLVDGLGGLVRYVSSRLRVKRSSFVFTGIYWIYRPYYFEDVDMDGMMSIGNGIDTHMVNRVTDLGRHKILMLKEIGVDCMDLQNEDYPWRQFQDGIWHYANKEQLKLRRDGPLTRSDLLIHAVKKRFPFLSVLARSAAYWHPWFLRGWLWARRNSSHDAVVSARSSTMDAWSILGSKHVKNIRNWDVHGRTGTGFD